MTSPSAENTAPPPARTKGPVVLNRTCQGCRNRKTRCIIVPQNNVAGNPECVRCSKLSLDCIFLPRAISRKRKRNETRIKELERKLQEIQEAVAVDQRSPSAALSDPPNNSHENGTDTQATLGAQFVALDTPSTMQSPLTSDPVSRGLVSEDTAASFFWTFCNTQAAIYPLVLIPPGVTWQDVRIRAPELFRAILTAGAGSQDPPLFKALSLETGKYLAEKVVANGEKSLGLIQALLILSTWYHPPGRFDQLKFSQYANMAATMVMDLRSSSEMRFQVRPDTGIVPTDDMKETCRTYLACYFLCSSMALSHRRPTVLRHGSWVDDCMSVLLSGDVHLNDRRLIEWTKLQRIGEESLAVIGFECDSKVDFSDAGTRFVLKSGVERTLKWIQNLLPEILTAPILMHYHMILISLHEPALYDGHDLSDFRPPYTLRSLPLAKNSYSEISLEVANALTQCVVSAQQIIHTFLSLPIEFLRSAPVITYTRISYAAVVLIKFDVSARMPQSVANLLDDSERDPKILLFQLLDKLGAVVGLAHFHVAATFRGVLSRMVKWYVEQFDQIMLPNEDSIIEPLMQLSAADDNCPLNTQATLGVGSDKSFISGVYTFNNTAGDFQESIEQFQILDSPSDWHDLPDVPDAWSHALGVPLPAFSKQVLDIDSIYTSWDRQARETVPDGYM